jgi:hypothetical protein
MKMFHSSALLEEDNNSCLDLPPVNIDTASNTLIRNNPLPGSDSQESAELLVNEDSASRVIGILSSMPKLSTNTSSPLAIIPGTRRPSGLIEIII